MRINYNVSASIANKNLLGIESNLSQSMERLSSGLKINHAKDNPAGMAISRKMKAQIDGLDRASANASDGISVIHISDGALGEVTSILQRMRELSVQAASDATMGQEDKEAIQKEISSLKDEVDRISKDTEYNTKTLLDGSLDTRVYTKHASRIQVTDQVSPGNYEIKVKTAATQAEVTSGADFNSTAAIGVSGTMSVNGSTVEIAARSFPSAIRRLPISLHCPTHPAITVWCRIRRQNSGFTEASRQMPPARRQRVFRTDRTWNWMTWRTGRDLPLPRPQSATVTV